jgi:hypothetical protein
MTKSEFLNFVKEECKKHKVKCVLKNTSYLKIEGITCSGLFYPEGKLVVAMKSPMAYEILLHEYCHMTQWIEQTEEWKNHQKINPDQFSGWLNGTPCRNIKKYIKWIIDVELDNEKRAVKMIKKINLDFIDINLYIKKANAYVQFYNWVLKNRKWSKPNKPIYKSEAVLSLVPSKFNMDYSKISDKLNKAMCFHYDNG